MTDRALTESHQEQNLRELAQEYAKRYRNPTRAAQLIAAADEIKALRAVLLNREATQATQPIAQDRALEIARSALVQIANLQDEEAGHRAIIANAALARMNMVSPALISIMRVHQRDGFDGIASDAVFLY